MRHTTYNLVIKGVANNYATRAEAIDTMCALLKTNSNYSIADFSIEEVVKFNREGAILRCAQKIQESFEIFKVEFKVNKCFTNDGDGFAELAQISKYPSLSMIDCERLIRTINEFNATLPEGFEIFFTISHKCEIRLFMADK